jgi:ribosomal protein L35
MSRALNSATLEMVAYLAETSITVKELLELQVGDVIKTHLPADGEITLCVEAKTKFKGRPGRVRRNKANKSHILTKKTAKRKRGLRKATLAAHADERRITGLLTA